MYLFEHKDFNDLITQTANSLQMPVAFVEKDYWITYTLYRLQKSKVDDFIFKGGTSLTKGWDLLERFSEDIDLLFTPHTISKAQKTSRLKKVKMLVENFEGLSFKPKESKSSGAFRMDCYEYEKRDRGGLGPLLPHIKLEMGYRGGDHPIEIKSVQSYVGTQLTKVGQASMAEDVSAFEIKILDHKRTFVEKLYAIHSAYQENQITKYFRHYYDIYKLLQMDDVQKFIGTREYVDLKKHVQEMSAEYFAAEFTDSFQLSESKAFEPTDGLISELDRALNGGAGLFFLAPPSAVQVVEQILKIRSKI